MTRYAIIEDDSPYSNYCDCPCRKHVEWLDQLRSPFAYRAKGRTFTEMLADVYSAKYIKPFTADTEGKVVE